MDAQRFLRELENSRYYRNQIVAVKQLPEREARFSPVEPPLPVELAKTLELMGIHSLYVHQAMAVEKARQGEDFVVVTSTASGKTLCYTIPVIERLLEDPESKALYLFPTKALAQDQLRGLNRFVELNPNLPIKAGTYDGDTPRDQRQRLRDQANCILTNPDMLHAAILPHHSGWGAFFSNLKYIVLDEVHSYRGVFGSNVANVLRRLKRICAHYGSRPQFICCSATIANPGEHASRLTGSEMAVIDDDGSPKGKKFFVLWNPPLLDESGERRSANAEAKELFVRLLRDRVQTIVFTRARVVAELIYRYTREELQRYSTSLAGSIRAYRGGYLPEERRRIEKMLFSGELLGVTSTNALELGIDIGTLDTCLIVGYPGTIASTWQQAGRAGRGTEESLAVLIGHNTPIDQYLMRHPDYFFGQNPENAIIDPDNPYIVLAHLRCAVRELPLAVREEKLFGEFAPALLDILSEDRQVSLRADRWYWKGAGYPADDFSLRTISENTYTIVEMPGGPDGADEVQRNINDPPGTNRVIGSIDELSAFTQLHTEAIYMHDGETYFVENLDVKQKVAYVRKADVDYYTQAVTDRRVQVEETADEKNWRRSKACFGEVSVTFITYMFKKIKFYEKDSIGFGKVDVPQSVLETCGFWLVPPLEVLHKVRQYGRSPAEGLLGIANVVNEVIPLFAMCDSMDIGTVVDSSNTGVPSVFVFDRYPGGVGFAQKAYELIEDIMNASLELILACGCSDGCPSCVGSPIPPYAQTDPDSEMKGSVPDKEAALVILHFLLERGEYVPKAPAEHRIVAGELAASSEATSRPPSKPLPENVELRIRKQLKRLGN